MAGGLLNLLANENSNNGNIHFIGNPSIFFFYSTFNQFCNFAMQKFRIDYIGNNNLQQNNSTNITFTMPRYADLLTDTYLAIRLPDIFSPIFNDGSTKSSFDFKWIKDIGTNLISEISISIGGTIIQRYSGNYIKNVVERDFDAQKKDIFNRMIGNVPEIHSPNLSTHTYKYPNSYRIYPNSSGINSYPSIKSRELLIPINSWFTLSNYLAFPLIALQYQELQIDFTLRPLSELYVVRDLDNINTTDFNLTPYIRPDGTPKYNLATFLINYDSTDGIIDNNTDFNTILQPFNIHLVCTQIFLSEKQRDFFARNNQKYLFRDIREHTVFDIVGNNRINIESFALVSGWMWYLQRDDIKERNEWSNYTNLLYENYNINGNLIVNDMSTSNYQYTQSPEVNDTSNIFIRPKYTVLYEVEILQGLSIICDGAFRENLFSNSVYDYIDFYNKTNGSAKNGLYFYSLSLEHNISKIQPSGFFNTNFFKRVEFEIKTLTPNIDAENSNITAVCDENGDVISIYKSNRNLFEYTYTFILQEERYNILEISSGMARLEISR